MTLEYINGRIYGWVAKMKQDGLTEDEIEYFLCQGIGVN